MIKLDRMYGMQEVNTQEMQWGQEETNEWNELLMFCMFGTSAKLRKRGCWGGIDKPGGGVGVC